MPPICSVHCCWCKCRVTTDDFHILHFSILAYYNVECHRALNVLASSYFWILWFYSLDQIISCDLRGKRIGHTAETRLSRSLSWAHTKNNFASFIHHQVARRRNFWLGLNT